MNKLYISNDEKPIRGAIPDMKHIERTQGGFIITFRNENDMHKAARVLMNSGYETVHKIGGIFW